jgi:hypothetical protein
LRGRWKGAEIARREERDGVPAQRVRGQKGFEMLCDGAVQRAFPCPVRRVGVQALTLNVSRLSGIVHITSPLQFSPDAVSGKTVATGRA